MNERVYFVRQHARRYLPLGKRRCRGKCRREKSWCDGFLMKMTANLLSMTASNQLRFLYVALYTFLNPSRCARYLWNENREKDHVPFPTALNGMIRTKPGKKIGNQAALQTRSFLSLPKAATAIGCCSTTTNKIQYPYEWTQLSDGMLRKSRGAWAAFLKKFCY